MKGLFTLCATTYLLIYAFEGAIRYALFNVGADSAILLRDALLIVPLLLLLIQQARRGKIHPAFLVFAVIVGVHGAISYLNLHTEVAAIYGTKLLVPVLFGFIAGVVAAHRGLNPRGGPKGVGDAVNQSVVIAFMLLFFVNLVLTAIYLQVIPAKGS